MYSCKIKIDTHLYIGTAHELHLNYNKILAATVNSSPCMENCCLEQQGNNTVITLIYRSDEISPCTCAFSLGYPKL